MVKTKILITGGAGFIGANLIRELLENRSYEIHAIIRKNGNPWRINEIKNSIVIHEGLLDDKEKLKKLVKKVNPRIIYHLAAYGSYPSQQDKQQMIDVNISGILNLLEATKEINYKRLIVAGSSSEYGKKTKPMKETDLLEPNNFYAVTKAAQTHLAQVFAFSYNKPITILRLFNVYGPFEERGRLVRSVIESALAGSPILLASGKEARDLVYTEDVSNAFITASRQKSTYGEVFNIGTGAQTSILELAKKVINLTGSTSEIKLNSYPGRPWDTYHWVADVSKSKRKLKWKSENSLSGGLEKTITWYQNNTNLKHGD